MSDPIVGIDLGTSNSVVAYAAESDAVSTIADEHGVRIHPSVVSFHPNGGVVVGAAAKQRKVIDPRNTIYSAKRLIGRSFKSNEVQTARSRVPYVVKEGPNQQPIVATRGGEFAVPEISAIVLDYVRNIATASLGQTVSRAVVTVPASFTDAQRSATATAGAIAGLNVMRVINEPTAAALAYGNTRGLREVIAVYDFGGGTFDVTILKLDNQVYEVLGTAGDTFLGGDDLDERLVDRMVEKFLLENRLDLRTDEIAMMRLRAVAEQTKIELSRRARAVVRVDEIAYGPQGKPLDLQIEITRDEFVRRCADMIDRTFPVCQEALAFASLGVDRIDDVILVGGTTKIPYVRDQVARFFARAPRTDVNPEEAVAVGAALQATSLERILTRTSAPQLIVDEPSTTTVVADLEDTATATHADYPLPPMEAAEEELFLQPPESRPPRTTAGYAARGEHHDTFEAAPSPPTASIGRMTKTNIQSPAAKAPVTAPEGDVPRPRLATPAAGAPAAKPPPALTPRTARTPATGMPVTAPAPTPGRPASSPSIPPTFTAARPPSNPVPRAGTPRAVQPPALDPQTSAWLDEASVETQPPPASGLPAGAKTLRGAPAQVEPTRAKESDRLVDRLADADASAEKTAPRGLGAQPPTLRPAPAAATSLPSPFTEPTRPAVAPSPSVTERGFIAAPGNTEPSMPPAGTARGFGAIVASKAGPAEIVATPIAPVVLDVTPRGLGVGTVAGYCEELIRRNSRVPTEIRKLFTTSRDGQDSVRIIVCQGESRRLDSNVVLGNLMLQGITPQPRGEVTIEVTFMLDASGILQVRARDAQTGREQRASLDLVGAMPQQEVAASRERMQQLRR